jgi:lysophospholipase L1-like esterase
MFRILNLALIALSLIAFSFSPAAAQAKYERAHLWEKEINAFTDSDLSSAPKTGGVLFVGSSSIRGWRTVADDFPKYRVLNRGFGGSHMEDVIHYAPRVVYPYKPELIVLYAGENDLTAGKTVDRVFADFKSFVNGVHERLPKTRIIYISAKPSPARWKLAPVFTELNTLIKDETEKDPRLFFVDIWPPMLNADGTPNESLFLGDKLHMKPAGYKLWQQTLLPALQKGAKGNFR